MNGQRDSAPTASDARVDSGLFRVYETVGKDGYPPEWHAAIKWRVRELAEHRCVRCGHPYVVGESGLTVPNPKYNGWTFGEKQRIKTMNVSVCDEHCTHGGPFQLEIEPGDWIEVADPGRGFFSQGRVRAIQRILTVHHLNMDKADCRWWNLTSLCQRCHLTVQGRVNMQRIWPWEHTAWFKPYAAGYYASVYLGEELTRDETNARMDELLALEHHPRASSVSDDRAIKNRSEKVGGGG